jgi:hypothetical protein
MIMIRKIDDRQRRRADSDTKWWGTCDWLADCYMTYYCIVTTQVPKCLTVRLTTSQPADSQLTNLWSRTRKHRLSDYLTGPCGTDYLTVSDYQ